MSNLKLPSYVEIVFSIFKKHNFESFVVGGCVRDFLLGIEPKDWDITTNCHPNKVIEIFEEEGFNVIPKGIDFGIVSVMVDNNEIEIATYRLDSNYSDGRRPDEVFYSKSIDEDLKRRDLTINAIAYNPEIGYIDLFGGMNDLNSMLIRAVGNPQERILEDSLRMLRVIRIGVQKGFEIEENTFESIKNNSKRLQLVSKERIIDELFKIFKTEGAKGIRLLKEANLLEEIIPEIKETYDFEQNNPYHDKDIFEHTMSVLDNLEKDISLKLAGLFHDIGKPKTYSLDESNIGHFYGHELESLNIFTNFVKRNNIPTIIVEETKVLIITHMLKEKNVKKLCAEYGYDLTKKIIKLQIADLKGSKFTPERNLEINKLLEKLEKLEDIKNQPLKIKDLVVSGDDVMDLLKLKPSKKIGDILRVLMDLVIEDETKNNREFLLNYVETNFKDILD